MVSRLRGRRVARSIARAHGLRSALRREWRWARRDLRDFRAELRVRRLDRGWRAQERRLLAEELQRARPL